MLPGGQILERQVYGTSLEGNLLGDSPRREVLIYLPPSYQRAPRRRFPVVYLLHSYGAGPRSWTGENGYEGMDIRTVVDSLVAAGAIEEMIVVMPNAQNRLRGSWYANSPATGNWEDFLARDLVAYVDSTYRTIAERGARGIAGQSMGAYGALRLALRRPDVFGAAFVMSSPHISNPNPFGERAFTAAMRVPDGAALDTAPVPAVLMLSKAAAFAPDPGNPPFFGALPYTWRDGRLEQVEQVWQRWMQSTLLALVSEARSASSPIRLWLEVGDRDGIRSDMEHLSRTLLAAGVGHTFRIFPGGHVAGVRARFETTVFQFFSAAFRRG
ncbi:MAG TPA: alpha/beta hydrolase [Longimicrobiaceae bacterium]|nr:alpha/beta hydrolase [Longimicrobiaceae bacterium]